MLFIIKKGDDFLSRFVMLEEQIRRFLWEIVPIFIKGGFYIFNGADFFV